jgi:propionate CoA-transferase
VFDLTAAGLELREVAPGIDIERDILAQMEFKPIVPEEPEVMDTRIFRSEPMGLREDMLSIPLDQRFTYDPQQNLFFVNFERFSVRSRAEIRAIVKAVEDQLLPLGHRVYAIVNYDNFTILPELLDEYSAAVRSLVDRFYSGVSRYTTSGFLRIKLGEALEKRGVAPHIFQSAAEAQSDFRNLNRSCSDTV